MIRKISAHYLYLSKDKFFKYGIVSFSANGLIIDVVDTHGELEESEKLEFFDGMIVPHFMHIDVSNLHPGSVILNADSIKDYLKIPPEKHWKYIILEHPESIEKEDIHQLMMLERVGIGVILHFGDSKNGNQSVILDKIRNLQEAWRINLTDILPWVTINPASAEQIDGTFGSIQINKVPGLNVITGIDYQSMQLKENSSVRVII